MVALETQEWLAIHCVSAENVHQRLRVLFHLSNIGYNWSSVTTGYVCLCIYLFEVQLCVRNVESWPITKKNVGRRGRGFPLESRGILWRD